MESKVSISRKGAFETRTETRLITRTDTRKKINQGNCKQGNLVLSTKLKM